MSLASRYVLGVRVGVDATSYEDASRRVLRWARRERSAYVCVASVHTTMEAYASAAFRRVVNEADLVTPEGRPLVWVLKSLGVKGPSQVRGANLMTHVAERAARENVPIGLYDGTPELLETFVRILETQYPKIRVVCQVAPPFRLPTSEENEVSSGS